MDIKRVIGEGLTGGFALKKGVEIGQAFRDAKVSVQVGDKQMSVTGKQVAEAITSPIGLAGTLAVKAAEAIKGASCKP